jgi:hypothetical protein
MICIFQLIVGPNWSIQRPITTERYVLTLEDFHNRLNQNPCLDSRTETGQTIPAREL